jgi:hypothetical protein
MEPDYQNYSSISGERNNPSFDNDEVFMEDKSSHDIIKSVVIKSDVIEYDATNNVKSDVTDDDEPHKPTAMTKSKFLVVACILLTEMCERLTYYSVVANIPLYATSVLKYSSSLAADIALVFTGEDTSWWYS